MALNYDFRDLSDSSRMNHFGNCVKVIKKKLLVENARFYEYYVRILAFKLGNNPYDMGSSEQQILWLSNFKSSINADQYCKKT